mmetsp:Transcript_36408/g.37790  ORF Transcript_36408/g.37790 Transcript_36408/m.37790 type:complete len:305 (-) Transcript_36408:69-983(-)
MIKALLFISLFALAFTTEYEVLLFRGQIPICTAKVNFGAVEDRLLLTDVTFAENTSPDAWNGILHENEGGYYLPLSNSVQWENVDKPNLGVLLQTQYHTENGDKFKLTIAIPLCNNELDMETINSIAGDIEEKRQFTSVKFKSLLDSIRSEGTKYITSSKALAILHDSKADLNNEIDKLEEENRVLLENLNSLNDRIGVKDRELMDLEDTFSEKCSDSTIEKANLFTYKCTRDHLRDQIAVKEKELISETTLSTEEVQEYDAAYEELIQSIAKIRNFIGDKAEEIVLDKESLLHPEALKPILSV